MFKKFVISLVLGLFIAVFFAQHDEWLKKEVAAIVCQQINSTCTFCLFTCDVSQTSINFFTPEIVLNNVCVSSVDSAGWYLKCKKLKVQFSWWHLLWYGEIGLYVVVDGCEASSTVEGENFAIWPYLQEFFAAPQFAIGNMLKSIVVHKGTFTCADPQEEFGASFAFSSESMQFGTRIETVLHITDGSLVVQGCQLYNGLSGALKSEIDFSDCRLIFSIDCSCVIKQLGSSCCLITGSWKEGVGRFTIRDTDRRLVLDPMIIMNKDNAIWVDVTMQMPLDFAWRLMFNDLTSKQVAGTCELKAQGALDWEHPFEGHCQVKDAAYGDTAICNAVQLNFKKNKKFFEGTLLMDSDAMQVAGSWQYDWGNQSGKIQMNNVSVMTLPILNQWEIGPKDFKINAAINSNKLITGFYDCIVTNSTNELTQSSHGAARLDNSIFNVIGFINRQRYECAGSVLSAPYVQEISYFDVNDAPLIMLTSGEVGQQAESVQADGRARVYDQTITGTAQYTFLRNVLQAMYNYDAQGEGKICLSVGYGDGIVGLDMHLVDGTVRLPQTYNFINGFDASIEYDINQNTIQIPQAVCTLHAGSARMDGGIVTFDRSCNLVFAHIPILFDHCLLNLQKDLFAVTSGYAVLSKQSISDSALLRGQFILDRAQLKQNVFSLDVQRSLLKNASSLFILPNWPIDLALTIETKQPIHIDTPLLQADAMAHFAIKNKVSDPIITGSINLLSGKLKFSYKPLQITKGIIEFLPGQLYNPVVELIAKNQIKKYLVTLQVNGFLKDHQVILESSPSLTEEQIVSLLLVGSEKDSLNVMMPALIAQNFKMALFGNQSPLLDKYFNRGNSSFNINLIPSFTDQTGRGGLRGGIEINVKDRWRALIQKNFSLSEDTRFELEYLLSDDISARMVRDERRDIGGEVEMKWKF